MSTATPLFDRRPAIKRPRRQIGTPADETREQAQVGIFIGLFTAIAIVMCAMAVIVSGDSLDGKLWLVWLIFVGGLSKLLLANGVFWGLMHQDEQTQVEQAARARKRGTSSLSRATAKLPALPRVTPPKPVRIVRRGALTLAADNPDRTPRPR